MEATCSSGLSSLSLSPSLSGTHTHTHKLTCLEREVEESTFQMPGLLGRGDEHTLAGHPGTVGCGRAGWRDTGEALPWPLAQAASKPDLQAQCPLFFWAPEACVKPGLRLLTLGGERRR